MKKIFLLVFLFSFSVHASIDEYDLGQKLANCAGFLSFWSDNLADSGLDASSKSAAEKSYGWRIASLGAFYSDGFSQERRNSLMQSAYETSITTLKSRIESGESFESIKDAEMAECLSLNDFQELYRKKMKSLYK